MSNRSRERREDEDNQAGKENTDGLSTFLGVAAGIGLGIGALFAAYKGVEMMSNASNPEQPQQHNFNERELLVADSEAKCKQAAATIKRHCEQFKYLGFDCLWTNNPGNRREEVGMLQLATNQGFCALIRLNDLRDNISSELKDILRDQSILKVGVGAHRDTVYIHHDYEIVIRGTLDLSLLAEQAGVPYRGLASLAENLTDIDVTETNAMRTANWEIRQLTSAQINYAKNCALAGIRIFENLRDRIINNRGFDYYRVIEDRLQN